MTHPQLFDVVELLVNIPEYDQLIGAQGTTVERYDNENFEVEFANETGETTALCTLSSRQFIVVWQSATQQWLPAVERVASILKQLPESKQEEVLNYARSVYQKT